MPTRYLSVALGYLKAAPLRTADLALGSNGMQKPGVIVYTASARLRELLQLHKRLSPRSNLSTVLFTAVTTSAVVAQVQP